jgi:RsiW-degrading membrane proteinase PrsW (M82 family)
MDQVLAFLVSLFLGFLPMLVYAFIVYMLDRYEKEPLFLLGAVFSWGAVVAAAGAFIINTTMGAGIIMATHSEGLANLTTGFMIAPLVEETLKGFAVLLVFLFYHNEFDSILDGIVYAAVTALGFAATENAFYIYNLGYLKGGWDSLISVTFVRTIVVGWQHPFFTSFLGIGLAYARLHQSQAAKIFAPLAGWSVSIFTHSFHNLMADLGVGILCVLGSILDWTGWIAMLIFIIMLANRENLLQKQYLLEEIDLGNITSLQYFTAQSMRSRLAVLFKGHIVSTMKFYQLCAELAHKKSQLDRFGDENGNGKIITNLRNEMRQLSQDAAA